MKTLVKTNDVTVISFIEALLSEADIAYMVLDQHMSILEGSLGMIPRRIVVDEDAHAQATRILNAADLGHELERDGS